ncbi:MAG: hypothetical protein ACRCUE_01400 [Bosea sp. (in: a-proteobacteria)]
MQKRNGTILFSASDLVNFMGCTHATFMDLRQLEIAVTFSEDDEQTKLLQQKGIEHERAYLQRLRVQGLTVVDIDSGADIDEKAELTLPPGLNPV